MEIQILGDIFKEVITKDMEMMKDGQKFYQNY